MDRDLQLMMTLGIDPTSTEGYRFARWLSIATEVERDRSSTMREKELAEAFRSLCNSWHSSLQQLDSAEDRAKEAKGERDALQQQLVAALTRVEVVRQAARIFIGVLDESSPLAK